MPFGRSGVLLAFLPALLLLSAHAGQREVDFPDYPKELLVERGARWKFLGNLMDPSFQHTSLQTNLFSIFNVLKKSTQTEPCKASRYLAR